MFNNCVNTNKQGDVGMACAIQYFAMLGYVVSIPLTDSQDYDIIVDNGKRLFTVQVKTTKHKTRYNRYIVNLKTSYWNKKGNFARACTDMKYDLLFVLTESGTCYLIPKSDIRTIRNGVVLGNDKNKYKVYQYPQVKI